MSEQASVARVVLAAVALLAAVPAGEAVVVRGSRRPLGRWTVAMGLSGIALALAALGLEIRAGDLLLNVCTGRLFVVSDLISWAAIGMAGGVGCGHWGNLGGRLRPIALAAGAAVGALAGWVVTAHLARVDLYWGITVLATPPTVAGILGVWLGSEVIFRYSGTPAAEGGSGRM